MVAKEYRDRSLVIYCYSKGQKDRFIKFAKSRGSTFSKFAVRLLEEAMNKEHDNPSVDVITLQKEFQDLRKGYRDLTKISANQAHEIMKLRSRSFLAPEGEANLADELLELLHEHPQGIQAPVIIDQLMIDPGDTDTIAGIARQLEMLEATGFIQKTSRGWTWKSP